MEYYFRIDYSPLLDTLEKQGKKIGDLKLNFRTAAKIKKGESMTLATIGGICSMLDVEIEKVVRIDLSFDD